ncbi:MAG: hypothetical protein ABI707_14200 [Ferruginibacter sp.]
MKALKKLVLGAAVLSLISCASTVRFPVSSVTPAAEITAKKKQDKNKNFVIEVKTKNMASADRLNPPKENYTVWVVTENNGTKNIGKLKVKNGKKSSLKTSFPFTVKEIFITAEDQSELAYPSGIEISRASF